MRVYYLSDYRKKKMIERIGLCKTKQKELVKLVSNDPVGFINEVREMLIEIVNEENKNL